MGIFRADASKLRRDCLLTFIRNHPTGTMIYHQACLMLVVVYLTYLYNEFFIQKLLEKQP